VDFGLYARVLWRFRLIVALGFLLALALAFLSMARISSSGISYRRSQLWSSNVRLLVTQRGAPEVRLYAQGPTKPGTAPTTPGDEAARLGIPVADPGRFNTLAILYAELATSDPVRRLISPNGPIQGQITAAALRDDQSAVLLPLIDLAAVSTSPRGAENLARQSAHALETYVSDQQRTNNVPTSDRVVLETIMQPTQASVFRARSKTIAIVVFLAAMLATIGLTFLLENLRPRVRELGESERAEFQSALRRTG